MISKTVYSLYWPETRRIVDSLWKSTPHDLYTANYTKKQNETHAPFLKSWREWVAQAGVELGRHFKHDYPTNGASEGIHHVMTYYATRNERDKPVVHVFEGEYEGYRKTAEALKLKVYTHKRYKYEDIAACSMPGDLFWISQPSAIDGNVWPGFADWVQWMNKNVPSVNIVVDLTYVGAVAKDFQVALTSTNIKVVLWSLSKPFGVYYHRIGGLVSSIELPSLYGNYWFKNLFSLQLGTALMEAYGPHELPKKYLEQQKKTIQNIKITPQLVCQNQVDLIPSDVVILAHQKFTPVIGFKDEYARVSNNHEIITRYCLTPGMDLIINYKEDAK